GGYFNKTPHNHQAFPLDVQSETGNVRNLKNASLNIIFISFKFFFYNLLDFIVLVFLQAMSFKRIELT
ncbi:hypothetical protein ABTO25_20575, partial [Acinetobacter baumannii]